MAFVLDSLREKFGGKEEEESKGFPDMNYVVGNTSGLDVGNIPTPLDRRVGSQSQLGGGLMEVKLSNPATFSVEKDRLIPVIDQLGIDITLHCDMNMGFASAYKTRGQQAVGFDTVHRYFTNYLQEMAKFKTEVEEREDIDFNIGRINPHISTSPLPPREERMPMDVGLDPFGFSITENEDEIWEYKNAVDRNIFKNKEFLRKFYYTFVKKRTVDQLWRLFFGRQGIFSNYSDKFDRIFRDAQRRACDVFYDRALEDLEGNREEKLKTMVALVSTAGRADVGVQDRWLSLIEEEFEDPVKLEIDPSKDEIWDKLPEELKKGLKDQLNIEIKSLDDLNDLLPINTRVTRLSTLPEAIYKTRNKDFNTPGMRSSGAPLEDILKNPGRDLEKLKNRVLTEIEDKLDTLWKGPEDDKFLISVQGKRQALVNHLDIEQQRIFESALHKKGNDPETEGNDWDLDEAAEEVIAGNDAFFEETQNGDDRYQRMLDTLTGNFEQPMWMESNIFYYILPAWMSSASYSSEEEDGENGHRGWTAPEFIWHETVLKDWDEEYDGDYDIDLKNPDKPGGYFDALEESREFRMDVAAAVGSCYVWGHFTQINEEMDIENFDFLDDEDKDRLEGESKTWVEWMNEFGIGVNMEAMAGDIQQLFKVWRPKDIVTASRAINLTAEKIFDQKEIDWHDDLDRAISKMTIDMEHVASLGADPWKEMKLLIEKEEDLADKNRYDVPIIEDKPLARVLRQFHLMHPGVESQQGTRHGPIERGDLLIYRWLYKLVEAGFARNPDETASIMYEQGEEKGETTYMARVIMDMIQIGIEPEDLDPNRVDPQKDEYRDEEEALMARFFGMDKPSVNREWAKIEEHAFDPLKGLLESEQFDHTWSGRAAMDNDNRPQEWQEEQYR